ncbi:CBS domain-containing protein [Candidatus Halobeggiatoa sp. HSG11]|nr:CBS domain-containing protein [Candidatus Halobeggiatoa sp. HSG11]
MLVKEIMTRAVRTINPDTRLTEVASIMCLNRFSGLPVIETDDIIIGILSEQDVLRYLFPDLEDIMGGMGTLDFENRETEYKKVLPLKAVDLMTKEPVTVSPDMPILKSVSVMARRNFRRIPVADGNKLVGMVSLGDIHRAIFMQSFSER